MKCYIGGVVVNVHPFVGVVDLKGEGDGGIPGRWDCILVVKDKMSRPMMEKAGVLGRRMTHIKKAMRP